MPFDANGKYVQETSDAERRWNPQEHLGMDYATAKRLGQTGEASNETAFNGQMAALQQERAQIQMEQERNAMMRAQGLMPDGTPIKPEWQSMLDPDGNIKYQYRNDVAQLDPSKMEGYSKYKNEAMRTGPSAWANMQLQGQQQAAQAQRAQAAQQAMTGNSQAMSQLAMRGGLGAGARTSLAKQSQRDLMSARQGVSRQEGINKLNLMSTDEQNRIQQLGNLASAETDIGKYNKTFEAEQREKNIGRSLKEVEAKRLSDANAYNEQMKKWAADRQAGATASSGGGGK